MLIFSLFLASRFRRPIWGLSLVLAGGSLVHCGGDGTSSDGLGDYSNAATGDGRGSGSLAILGSGSGSQSGSVVLNPICGAGECVPDRTASCADAGLGGHGGASALGQGGSGWGGAGGAAATPPPTLGCVVRAVDDCQGDGCEGERTCAAVGDAEEGDPCLLSDECGQGLACVGSGAAGVCRPYCCEGSERSCGAGSFCAERTALGAPSLTVPVCVPVDGCLLSEAYPCPSGQSCACSGEEACVVVRASGATACAVPGAGKEGDACTGAEAGECAVGHVCSPSQGCLKLCTPSTAGAPNACADGKNCQTPAGFPVDLGVCVGGATDQPAAP